MPFLPIVDRELRVVARRRETYSARTRIAAAAMIAGIGATLAYNYFGGAWTGFSLFQTLTNVLFAFCMVGGAHVTYDCLSEEKREGTIGLLFLTDLKGHDIVLGKLVSKSIGVACGCLVAFPVLVVLIPLGKAQAAEVGRMALALANTLFLSLSAGLLISSLSRKQQRARTGSLILILWLWLVMPQVAQWLIRNGFHPALYLPLQMVSPHTTYLSALIPGTGLSANRFWHSLGWTHLSAWGFVALACWILPHVWQDKARGPVGTCWRERFKQWCYGKASVRNAFRLRLLNRNPIYWLMGRDRLRRLWVWVFLSIVVGTGVSIAVADSNVLINPGLAAAFTILATLIVKMWVGSEASRGLADEKWNGTLEWLFCTTLSVREIVRGQWLALRWQFMGPLVFLLIPQLTTFVLGLNSEEFKEEDKTLWIWGCVGYVGVYALDVWALGWTGMWSGLTSKTPRAARGGAAIRIVVIPGIVFYIGMIAQAVWSAFGTKGNTPPMPLNMALWYGLGIVNSLSWGLWSRRQLYRRMRLTASERFASGSQPASWWERFRSKKEKAAPAVEMPEKCIRA